MTILTVKDRKGVYRDSRSGAIFVDDEDGYVKYKSREAARLVELEKDRKIVDLESRISKLEEVLTQLLGKQ